MGDEKSSSGCMLGQVLLSCFSCVHSIGEWGTPRLPPYTPIWAGPQASRSMAEGGLSSYNTWALGRMIQLVQALSLGTLQAMAIASEGIPTHAPSFALVTD